MSLLQFKQDLAPEKDFMKEWADASEFYISMRSKEANLKALGKDIGLGAGIGASIGAIRATGTKDPNETVGGKLKRIGTEAVDKAVDGTVQGLAVNGIRRMGAMRDAARGISKLSSWNNVIPKAKELGNTIYQGAKSTIKPIATDVGDRCY